MKEVQNDSGLPLKPVYSAEDRNGEEPLPGSFPFTRGIHKDMYRCRLWTMRQYAGFGTAAESNKRYRFLLQQGQTGLSVAFDLPTQIGYDSDDPMANGEVGKVGVAIDSLEDMEALLKDIPLAGGSTSMASVLASRSSSLATWTSSRRWPSFGPRAGCWRASCATGSTLGTRARRRCASIPRPVASPSRRSSPSTMSCGRHSRR